MRADVFALIEGEDFAYRCTVGTAVNDYPLNGTCYVKSSKNVWLWLGMGITALGWQRQVDLHELKISLVYLVSSRAARSV